MEVCNSLTGYNPKTVLNKDECGLLFNLLLDKTYALKGESCQGWQEK
jgi:hypothetical protein